MRSNYHYGSNESLSTVGITVDSDINERKGRRRKLTKPYIKVTFQPRLTHLQVKKWKWEKWTDPFSQSRAFKSQELEGRNFFTGLGVKEYFKQSLPSC